MLRILLLLFVVLPACEIGLMIYSGRMLGLLPTVLLIIATGIGGAYLAKYQGLVTFQKVQQQMNQGMMPGEELIDGISILAGGIFLVLPGFITDVIGLLLLLPPTRALIKPVIKKMFRKKMNRTNITIIQ
ncbi:FxsA family protein [Bacillus sp. 1P06AnD]|uniref:FxsA family protein n=1 Tax=Bacillus sp. 1P06AnD TaxID=3132208 RepID=UPI0039A1138B